MKVARLAIFDTCVNLIRCLPLLQQDDHDPEDVSDKPHEVTHGPEAIRYFCMSRPAASISDEDRWARKKKRRKRSAPVVSSITGY